MLGLRRLQENGIKISVSEIYIVSELGRCLEWACSIILQILRDSQPYILFIVRLLNPLIYFFSKANPSSDYTQVRIVVMFSPLAPELNPSSQRCLPRFFTWDFNF
jgi:hypothetical protein